MFGYGRPSKVRLTGITLFMTISVFLLGKYYIGASDFTGEVQVYISNFSLIGWFIYGWCLWSWSRLRKEILWEEQGHKCNKCDYNLYDPFTGPYEIHHLDGVRLNKSRDNEELVCCNCHAMTDNYRFKGRKHTNKSRKKISKTLKNK